MVESRSREVEGFWPSTPDLNLAAGSQMARERGCEPIFLADEAGGQPIGSGGENLSSGGGARRDSPGTSISADERPVPRLRQEFGVHEHVQ